MYYCSIYSVSDGVEKIIDAIAKVPQDEALVGFNVLAQQILTYSNRADAEKFKEEAIQYASKCSTKIKEQNGYTVLFGCNYDGITVRPFGGSTIIGIETDADKGQLQLLSYRAKSIARQFLATSEGEIPYMQVIQRDLEKLCVDGKTFESQIATQRQDALNDFEKSRADIIKARDKVIAKFEQALNGSNELEDILKALVATTSRRDTETQKLLIKAALLKIQNSTELLAVDDKYSKYSTDWYDQLSKLNS